jgi:hypothetical protein
MLDEAMPPLPSAAGAHWLLQILTSTVLAILFLQSGIDKVIDRRGNAEWLTGHFARSFLAGTVPLLLSVITILELAAGALSAVGAVMIALRSDSEAAFYGAVLAAVTLIALFFGQRVAKDYPGAASLIPYFLLTLAAIYLLAT